MSGRSITVFVMAVLCVFGTGRIKADDLDQLLRSVKEKEQQANDVENQKRREAEEKKRIAAEQQQQQVAAQRERLAAFNADYAKLVAIIRSAYSDADTIQKAWEALCSKWNISVGSDKAVPLEMVIDNIVRKQCTHCERKKTVSIPCSRCNGKGGVMQVCSKCNGSGQWRVSGGSLNCDACGRRGSAWIKCPSCFGFRTTTKECSFCGGSGWARF
jgi:Sec-independent protein translocase protein TatA